MSAEQTSLDLVYDNIFQHLINKSFGQEVYGDKVLCSNLRKAMPMMTAEMHKRQPTDFKVDIAYDVAAKLNEMIAKLKPHAERRLCFEAALVMMLYNQVSDTLYKTVDQLLERYPEFNTIACTNSKELNALLLFRNVMVIAIRLVSAAGAKNHLLDLVTRITEGRSVKYITGSGEKIETTCRVLIYRREGEVVPTPKRPKQTTSSAASGTHAKEAEDAKESSATESIASSVVSKSSKPGRQAKKRSNHKETDFAARLGKRSKYTGAAISSGDVVAIPAPLDALCDASTGEAASMSLGFSQDYSHASVFRGVSSFLSEENEKREISLFPPCRPHDTMAAVVDISPQTSGLESVRANDAPYVTLGDLAGQIAFNAVSIFRTASNQSDTYQRPVSILRELSMDWGLSSSIDRQVSLQTVGTPEDDFFQQQFIENPSLFGSAGTGGSSSESNGVIVSEVRESASAVGSSSSGYNGNAVVLTSSSDAAASLVLLRSSSAT